MPTMECAVYARKSTAQGGSEEARSVPLQVARARAWVAARGWSLSERHVFKDDGVSGYLFLGRPEFQRMLRAAEAGAFKALVLYDCGWVLWETDRFDEALLKYEEARSYEQKLPGNLKGALLLETGSTGAHAAKTPETRTAKTHFRPRARDH